MKTTTAVTEAPEYRGPQVSPRKDLVPCARCGVIRRAQASRPGTLCRDCNSVLSKADREAWKK